jgi:hypothetical protein
MVGYLRDLAHRCTRLARRCSDYAVSQELEGIGAELMQKRATWNNLVIHGQTASDSHAGICDRTDNIWW